MIVDELTHEDIWQVLDNLRDFCNCRDNCTGCFYSEKFSNTEGYTWHECAIRSRPDHWQTGVIKAHVEAEEEGSDE